MNLSVVLVACYGDMQPSNAEPLSIEVLYGAVTSRFSSKDVDCRIEILEQHTDPTGSLLFDKLTNLGSKIDVLGISIPQSTYYLATNFLDTFCSKISDTLVVLGHALPTHSPEIFLEKYPDSIIVRGWGEEAFCQIVEGQLLGQLNKKLIPNLIFYENQLITNNIKWPSTFIKPHRYQPGEYFARVESSRGCHYDVCTFCTRQPKEIRKLSWMRYPTQSVLDEIKDMKSLGITNFTFTDEDFIGNDIEGAEQLALGVKEIGELKFSLSVRVDNIVNPMESISLTERRLALFSLLKEGGLSLVYLGVESLSESQLKRYGKGVSPNDAIVALNKLRSLDIPIELGYILFDPFLSINELQENINWLSKSRFWIAVGQLFNNLRVQKDTAFVKFLKNKDLLGKYDPNTMSYDYSFEDPLVSQIASYCIQWKEEVDDVYSHARNINRTVLSESKVDRFVYDFRLLEFNMLKQFLTFAGTNGKIDFDPSLKIRRTELIIELKNSLEQANRELIKSEDALLHFAYDYLSNWNHNK